jgi:hypothetical protein
MKLGQQRRKLSLKKLVIILQALVTLPSFSMNAASMEAS